MLFQKLIKFYKMKKITILISLVFTVFVFSQTENEVKFKNGVEFYNGGDYLNAIDQFNEILINGEHSVELYFNLANSYYKVNDIPNSILYYEKALKIDPNNLDVLNNLKYSQNMLIDKIELLPTDQLSNILIKISNIFSINQWLSIGIIASYIFLILFILYYFKRDSNSKKKYFTFSSILFCISILFILTGITKFENQQTKIEAIIFDKKIDFRTEPNYRSEIQFNLHEGTKVKIKEELNDWVLVELSNGSNGWLELRSIKKIN